ncbi:MAG: DUF126 domain-containing protein [Candidatus Methanomethylophilaceae archaeon]|jgi:predicted aconitase with swiveling domain|nr:DUF126 domain-containing protein [Candidatus Methanomethylophilaceae archaeon]
MLTGRSISGGRAEGKVLKLDEPLSFLGGVNGSTGELSGGRGNVAGRILVFPHGKGSTVGSFTMYDLKVHGKAPAAVVNRSAETIVATGAVISDIPMVDSIDVDLISDGDLAVVDGDAGTLELPEVDMVESVTSALMSAGRVLMLKRPDTATSFPGRWSLVAGKIEPGESAQEAARREIAEETGISVGGPEAFSEPILVRENDRIWKVHPFIFSAEGAEPVLNSENLVFEWADPEALGDVFQVPGTAKVVLDLIGKSGRASKQGY